jgi:hypothetical protein
MAADIVASYRAQIEKAGRDAVTKFDAAVRHAGVSAQSQLLQMELAVVDQLFAETARRFDLSVVGQTKPGQEFPEEILPETALFGSGRPVLVVPYIQKTAMKLDRVLVCWDGSRAAARALGDAMPFLQRSKSIDIVTIAKNEEPRKNPMSSAPSYRLPRISIRT